MTWRRGEAGSIIDRPNHAPVPDFYECQGKGYSAAVTWYKSDIHHTYEEDMHPVYPPLPWLHTPWLRLGVTTVAEYICNRYSMRPSVL